VSEILLVEIYMVSYNIYVKYGNCTYLGDICPLALMTLCHGTFSWLKC
jgi:hypothetical protein